MQGKSAAALAGTLYSVINSSATASQPASMNLQRSQPTAFVPPHLRQSTDGVFSQQRLSNADNFNTLVRTGTPKALFGQSTSPNMKLARSGVPLKAYNNNNNDAFNIEQFLRDINLLPFKPDKNSPKISFDDVAGIGDAKFELEETVEFLKNPEKFNKLGARIPKGVLLVGPPGTGKTLLAKAVAGEAGVPFHSVTGSEFVEIYVGQGASKVRKVFKEAEKDQPCIIFIDEIDAVGKKRSAGMDGGSDERAQTLNQLLAKMDGFDTNDGIVIIATTNREDVLDEALLRPGRFDRKVHVGLPDVNGRHQILQVHAKNKPLAEDVDLHKVATRCIGFSGAELANLLNEAAIRSARKDLSEISMTEIDEALERVTVGLSKTDHVMSDDHKLTVAYHEAGHALVAAQLTEADEVQKISIVPQGHAAGITWFQPSAERVDSGLYTKAYLKNQLAIALGGRLAEELVFGNSKITTGASNDLQKVTNIAMQMVKAYGMSDELAPMNFEKDEASFIQPLSSPKMTDKIEDEVEKLVLEARDMAADILKKHRPVLDKIAKHLVVEETISGKDFNQLLRSDAIRTALNPSDHYLAAINNALKPY